MSVITEQLMIVSLDNSNMSLILHVIKRKRQESRLRNSKKKIHVADAQRGLRSEVFHMTLKRWQQSGIFKSPRSKFSSMKKVPD